VQPVKKAGNNLMDALLNSERINGNSRNPRNAHFFGMKFHFFSAHKENMEIDN